VGRHKTCPYKVPSKVYQKYMSRYCGNVAERSLIMDTALNKKSKYRTHAILTIGHFARGRTPKKTQMFSWHNLTGYTTKEQHA